MMTNRLFIIACISGSLMCCNPDENARNPVDATPDSTPLTNTEDVEDTNHLATADDASLIEAPLHSLADLNRRLAKRVSQFVIRTNRDTVLRCNQGTLLAIPADAFLSTKQPGAEVKEVRITVKEFYSVSDMITAGLSTRSDRRLLETGGMLNIRVSSQNNKDSCRLKPGKEITIAMPTSDSSETTSMQLFNGTHEDSAINWIPRNGAGGMAQAWGSRRKGLPADLRYTAGFVFPEGLPRTKPHMVRSKTEDLEVNSQLSLRNLMHHPGNFTQKVEGYIDTSGTLHCYNMGYGFPNVSFNGVFSPSSDQDMKVNVAVSAVVAYKADVNRDHFQKLFKMGKGKPDSLVPVTVQLNPAVRFMSHERLKNTYKSAVTVREFRRIEKQRSRSREQYLKKIEQLRLEQEQAMTQKEASTGNDVRSAEDYLILSTPQLGWINCDRFLSYPEKVDYYVRSKEPASLLIVFNSMRAIVASNDNGLFHDMPINEKITIVALKTEDGKLLMAMHETTVTEKPFENLSFQPVTVKEYKRRLERLNRL